MRLLYFSFLISLFSLFSSNAQSKDQLFFKVISLDTKKPISYATIRFENSKKGLVANVDGDFRIPKKYKNNKGAFFISCIGYNTKRVVLDTVKNEKLNIIYLKPKVEALEQVHIKNNEKRRKKLSAKQIVKKAIAEIENNYPTNPYSYISYYRDYQQVEGEYINLNEGIIEVFDQGFQSNKIQDSLNATALYTYKLNNEFSQDTLLSNSIYNKTKDITGGEMGSSIANELTLLDIHNPIRNFRFGSFSFVYVLKKNFVRNHIFYDKGVDFLENEALYKIEFKVKQVLAGEAYKVKGRMFISRNDFSIYRFDYELFSNSIEQPVFNLTVEYKRHENNKMYLNYITFNNNFNVSKEEDLKIERSNYDEINNSFKIYFDRPVGLKFAEQKSNIKIYFDNKKLPIRKIDLIDPSTIDVQLKSKARYYLDQQQLDKKSLFKIKIKNIEDSNELESIEKSKINGYQFRELFVQEIFPDKQYDHHLLYLKKGKHLNEAPINNFDISSYWMNTPLKINN